MYNEADHRTIASIYDLAMRPNRWPSVLDAIAESSDAGGAAVFVEDPTTQEFALSAASSVFTPEALREYAENYHEDDAPGYARLARFPPQRMFTDDEILRGFRDARSAPARIWLKERLGLDHRSAARLHDEGVWFDVMVAQYRDGDDGFTPKRLEPINRFLPHVTKVLEMSRTFAVLRHRFQAVLAALDRFHVGVMVLSPARNVVVKNREAQRILDLRDGLSLDSRDRPVASATLDRNALARAIDEAVRTARSESAESGTRLSLPRPSSSSPFLVEIYPFVDEGSEFEGTFRGAYVLVVDPGDTRRVSIAGMQDLYALTDAESAVCSLLVDGHSTGDMADMRGVTPETLRTQVKSLLRKTRTRSRSHLVRRALLVNLPIDREDASE